MEDKKVALISGGTSGIGLATAEVLLQKGWRVVINGRSNERGRLALEKLAVTAEQAVYVGGDVSTEEGCQAIVEKACQVFGRLDGLVTSAGTYEEELLENVSAQDMARIFDINVGGTVFLCKYAAPALRQTKGSIVVVASDAGTQGNIGCTMYCASKGAVVAFARSFALEMAPHEVRVNSVCPGDVETPLLERQLQANPALSLDTIKEQYPLYRIAKAGEIAQVIAFLLSAEASYVTAAAWAVDGGLTSW